ncbi:hypothetical protein ANTRET_LOCUS5778 [Anthophora retusa]
MNFMELGFILLMEILWGCMGTVRRIHNRELEPFKPEFSDLDYADVDYRSYGPIDYKAASIALLRKQQLEQQRLQQQQQLGRRPQMYGVTDDSEELL